MTELKYVFFLICLLFIVSIFWYNWMYRISVLNKSKKMGMYLPKKIQLLLTLNIIFTVICGSIITLLTVGHFFTEGK